MTETTRRNSGGGSPFSPEYTKEKESEEVTESKEVEWKNPESAREYNKLGEVWEPPAGYVAGMKRASELRENQNDITKKIDELNKKLEENNSTIDSVEQEVKSIESIYRSLAPLSLGGIVAVSGLFFAYMTDNISILLGSVGLLFVTLYVAWSESRANEPGY